MKSLIKTISFIGVFTLVTGFCAIGSVNNNPYRTVTVLKEDAVLFKKVSYPVTAIKNVKVSTSGGAIAIKGGASKEATLEMYVKANGNNRLSEKEMNSVLERDYDMSIELVGETLMASVKPKKGFMGRNDISVSFIISTGTSLDTDLITSGGSIQLTDLSGHLNFKTSGGSLKMQNLKGTIQGKTSGGSIQALDSEGTISLKTSGGSIKLENLKGNIDVATSGGSIKGNKISGSLQAKTSGGSIVLEQLVCRVNARTSGGSVTAQFDKLDEDAELATSAGSVNIALPNQTPATLYLRGSRVNTGDIAFHGTLKKGLVDGSIYGGGALIKATTSSGSVNLNFK